MTQILPGNYQVDTVHIHPDYVSDQPRKNNIAVVKVSESLAFLTKFTNKIFDSQVQQDFDPKNYPSHTVGGLGTNSSCKLYGNTAGIYYPVTAYNPAFCDESSPQAFCTKFPLTTFICSSLNGSPLICDDDNIDGILINDSGCVSEGLFQYTLYYHSVSDFKDWIAEVSGANAISKVSFCVLFIAALAFL